jgi:hypothetical protein
VTTFEVMQDPIMLAVPGASWAALNVDHRRLPWRESIVLPPSHCPHCDTMIRPWDNVPVVSAPTQIVAGAAGRRSAALSIVEAAAAARVVVGHASTRRRAHLRARVAARR